MEALPLNTVLEFHPDTLRAVRKIYNLHKPGKMDEAIDLLRDWVKKQNHFVKNDFGRDYLERTIITCKGSVERAKTRLDRLCTLRATLPFFFGRFDARNDFKDLHDIVTTVVLPKQTKDFNRVLIIKNNARPFESTMFIQFFRYAVILSEYLKMYDYTNGFIIVLDYREVNMLEYVTKLNPLELRQALTLFMEGYGMRLQGFHLMTTSKVAELFIAILKQILSAKIFSRVRCHKDIDTLYEYIPKEILPDDYDGKEISMEKLRETWLDALTTEEHVNYLKEMSKATTNEENRPADIFNEQYIGIPGTFRTLSLD